MMAIGAILSVLKQYADFSIKKTLVKRLEIIATAASFEAPIILMDICLH
jgi:hypothetical protein